MSQVEFETDQIQASSIQQARSYGPAPSPDPKKRRIQIVTIVVALAVTALVLFYGVFERPPAPSRASYPYEQPPKPISL